MAPRKTKAKPKPPSDAAAAPPPPPEPAPESAPEPAPEAAAEAPEAVPATVAVAEEASPWHPAKLIVVAALLAAVGGTILQTILTGLQLPWTATFFSPLHAVCLIAMLLIQVRRCAAAPVTLPFGSHGASPPCLPQMMWNHPAKDLLVPAFQERCTTLARSGRTGPTAQWEAVQDLLKDPYLQNVLALTPSPRSGPFMVALALSLVGDVCQALGTASEHVAWALLHALAASAGAGGFLLATWRDGASTPHAVRGVCWAGAFAPVVQAVERLLMHDDALVDSPALAEARVAAGASPLLLRGVLACRLLVCGVLAARCAEAVGGRLWARYGGGGGGGGSGSGLRPRPMDPRRLGLQLSGALLLLGAAMLPSLAPAAPAEAARTLGLGLDRLGSGSFGLSGWLLQHAPRGLDAEEAAAEAEAEGYGSIEEMQAAHRAKRARRQAEREARAHAAAPVVPLLRESWGLIGGVQGMEGIEAALRTDADGDAAHEFWEAVDGGCFRLATATGAVAVASSPSPAKKAKGAA